MNQFIYKTSLRRVINSKSPSRAPFRLHIITPRLARRARSIATSAGAHAAGLRVNLGKPEPLPTCIVILFFYIVPFAVPKVELGTEFPGLGVTHLLPSLAARYLEKKTR